MEKELKEFYANNNSTSGKTSEGKAYLKQALEALKLIQVAEGEKNKLESIVATSQAQKGNSKADLEKRKAEVEQKKKEAANATAAVTAAKAAWTSAKAGNAKKAAAAARDAAIEAAKKATADADAAEAALKTQPATENKGKQEQSQEKIADATKARNEATAAAQNAIKKLNPNLTTSSVNAIKAEVEKAKQMIKNEKAKENKNLDDEMAKQNANAAKASAQLAQNWSKNKNLQKRANALETRKNYMLGNNQRAKLRAIAAKNPVTRKVVNKKAVPQTEAQKKYQEKMAALRGTKGTNTVGTNKEFNEFKTRKLNVVNTKKPNNSTLRVTNKQLKGLAGYSGANSLSGKNIAKSVQSSFVKGALQAKRNAIAAAAAVPNDVEEVKEVSPEVLASRARLAALKEQEGYTPPVTKPVSTPVKEPTSTPNVQEEPVEEKHGEESFGGWTRYINAASGDSYYGNNATNETVWDKPDAFKNAKNKLSSNQNPVTPTTPTTPEITKAPQEPQSTKVFDHIEEAHKSLSALKNTLDKLV
jgi:hypothetical protein